MSSPKKCAICPIFLLEEGVEEHMRLMHSYSRPSITSQLKSTSAGPKIREVLGPWGRFGRIRLRRDRRWSWRS